MKLWFFYLKFLTQGAKVVNERKSFEIALISKPRKIRYNIKANQIIKKFLLTNLRSYNQNYPNQFSLYPQQ